MATYKISFELTNIPADPEIAKQVIVNLIHDGMTAMREENVTIEQLQIEDWEKDDIDIYEKQMNLRKKIYGNLVKIN